MRIAPISPTRWSVIAGLGLVTTFCFLLFLHHKLYPYSFDDAYIHFRIADNLAQDGLPYFNLNEPIKASSSSGWTVILGLIIGLDKFLGTPGEIPQWVAIFNALITFCGASLYTSLLIRVSAQPHHPLFYGIFFVMYIAVTLLASIGLMESAIALAIVGLAFHLLLNNSRFCLTCFGLAVFFRLELAVVFWLILIYVISIKRFSYKDIFIFSLTGVVPIVMYDLYFFGTVVPNTIKAKSTVYSLTHLQVIGSFFESLLPDVPLFLLSYATFKLFTIAYITGLVSLVAGVFIYRLGKSLVMKQSPQDEKEAIYLIISGWGLVVAGGYIFTKTLIFPWYVPLYAVPLLFILGKMILDSNITGAKSGLVILIIPLLVSQLFGLWQIGLAAFFNPVYYPDFLAGARVRQYIQVGKNLFDQYPQATLMTSEIGGLGYSFRGYIIDGAGLVSPVALAYHPLKVPQERKSGLIGAIPTGLIQKLQPDIIVSYDTFIEDFLKSEISKRYLRTKCQVFLEDDRQRSGGRTIWNNEYLNVFMRKDFFERAAGVKDKFFCQLGASIN